MSKIREHVMKELQRFKDAPGDVRALDIPAAGYEAAREAASEVVRLDGRVRVEVRQEWVPPSEWLGTEGYWSHWFVRVWR